MNSIDLTKPGPMTPERFAAHQARIDTLFVAAVCKNLGTSEVTLLEWRKTGRGTQVIPVFSVPADLMAKARSLGLEVR